MPYVLRALAALPLCLATATAFGFPDRPVRLVVPFAPGGNIDITARTIAPGMGEALGVQVLVENRAGAGGLIGSEAVVRAQPDGYTTLLGSTGTLSTAVALHPKIRFDPMKDLAPTSLVSVVPLVITVHPALPARSVKEFIALVKARPGKVTMASAGTGTSNHLAGEYFQAVTGTKMVHIPYKGSGPALTDLMGGQIDLIFDQVASSLPFIRSGRLKAIAVTTPRRSAALPDTPTLAESGLPGFDASTSTGVMLPGGTPAAIVTRMHAAVVQSVRMPSTREGLLRIGADPLESSPEDFAKLLRSEIDKWTKVVKTADIRVE
jgi:tripartite-type tricarboxylate transporter receptor subunit TctC